jgi:hypothetical protein
MPFLEVPITGNYGCSPKTMPNPQNDTVFTMAEGIIWLAIQPA